MPVEAIKAVSAARNGVGAFIHQCKRLDFHYCDWAGSSKGMNTFLQTYLAPLAQRSPQLHLHVSPRPAKHPCIRAHYVAQPPRSVCVRNMKPQEILRHAERLRDTSGAKNRRVKSGRFVRSQNESVRGVWSGMHEAMDGRGWGEGGRWGWGGGRASIGRGKGARRRKEEAEAEGAMIKGPNGA